MFTGVNSAKVKNRIQKILQENLYEREIKNRLRLYFRQHLMPTNLKD